MLLDSWSLPAGIVAAVSCHHHPRQAPARHVDAVWLTFAAETLCAANGPALAIEGLVGEGAEKMCDAIRAAGCAIDAVLEEVSTGMAALV